MKKKADKTNVTVNVNIFSNITLGDKSLIYIVVAIVSLTLVVSICDPIARAEIVRLLISMTIGC